MSRSYQNGCVETPEGCSRYQFSTRLVLVCITLVALGVSLCRWHFGSQHWGNWLHMASFKAVLFVVCAAFGLFIGSIKSRRAGMIAFTSLICLAIVLLWTFPGWLVLHSLIWNLTQ
jgi:hypothetical protein